jgi:hypothetical protein
LERNTVAKPPNFSLVASVSYAKAFVRRTGVFLVVKVTFVVRLTIHVLSLKVDFFMLARLISSRQRFGV